MASKIERAEQLWEKARQLEQDRMNIDRYSAITAHNRQEEKRRLLAVAAEMRAQAKALWDAARLEIER